MDPELRTEEEKRKLAQELCDFLNSLVARDAEALDLLIEHRVPCNIPMRDHPTVQVVSSGAANQEILRWLWLRACDIPGRARRAQARLPELPVVKELHG